MINHWFVTYSISFYAQKVLSKYTWNCWHFDGRVCPLIFVLLLILKLLLDFGILIKSFLCVTYSQSKWKISMIREVKASKHQLIMYLHFRFFLYFLKILQLQYWITKHYIPECEHFYIIYIFIYILGISSKISTVYLANPDPTDYCCRHDLEFSLASM